MFILRIMAKITESLKNLSVENDTKKHLDNKLIKKNELVLSIEETVSLDRNYILAICGTQSDPEFKISAALSDQSVVVYSVGENISRTNTLTHNEAPIVGIKFSPTSKNILYMATSNGKITMCDLRAKGKIVAEFKDCTEDGKMKPLVSFDISRDEKLVAGGTEHIGADAFILFWDIRHSNSKNNRKNCFLGGYWQSHMEDVTCLSFHSSKQDILASGSTDGLINVFDLTQPSEDLALTHSLNTESSVDKLGWLTDDNLWCTTFTHSLQLWNCEGATPYARFDRNNLVTSRNDEPEDCYVVKFHATNALGQPFLLAGSSNIKGENLRCLNITNGQLETYHNIVGNKQLVRDSWIHEKSACLITGGEEGIINIWKQTEPTIIQQSSGHKISAKISGGKGRERHHRTKPY